MFALALSAGLAVIYLIVIRFMDFNEREPVWGVVTLLLLGAAAAGVLNLAVSSATLELTFLPAALWETGAVFVAVAVGFALIAGSGRAQGWSELNGPMDGIVYGAAAGLGFVVGKTFVQEMLIGGGGGAIPVSGWSVLWSTALAGLAYAVYGAIIGAGLTGAILARSLGSRIGLLVIGPVVAVAAGIGYRALAYGNPFAGPSAFARTWIALLLPVLALVIVAIYTLTRERREIAAELLEEEESGAVTAEERALLGNHPRRLLLYWSELLSGRTGRWTALHVLHNQQVQLALIKGRVKREANPVRRANLEAQVARVRHSIMDRKKALAALDALRSTGSSAPPPASTPGPSAVVLLALGAAALIGLSPAPLGAQQQPDRDGDGIPDATDRCPDLPETFNGFDDRNGCPDSFIDLFNLGHETVDAYWREEMPKLGGSYVPPDTVMLYDDDDGATTECGFLGPGNAQYCTADRSVSFHRPFLEDLFEDGDFIPVVVIAHEFGHMAQHDFGTFDEDHLTIFTELQADCFAGSYSRYVDRLGYLDPGDVDEALIGLFRFGSTDVDWLHPASHGTGGERTDAFWWGFRFDADGCRGSMFNAAAGRPDDRFSSAVPDGPANELVPRPAVGAFTLITCKKRPELIGRAGTTDALECRYRSDSGENIDLEIIVKATVEQAREFFDYNTERWRERGYNTFDSGTSIDETLDWLQLRRDGIDIYWERFELYLIYVRGGTHNVSDFLNALGL